MTLRFEDTPQAKALQRRIAESESRYFRDDLSHHYEMARNHFESQQLDRLASDQVDPTPAVGKQTMSLEDAMLALTKAVEANTAALGKAPAATKPPATAPATKPPAAPAAPKITAERRAELAAIAVKYREMIGDDKGGKEKATALISGVGKSPKLKEVKDENVEALFAAFEAAITELEAGGGEAAAAADEM